MLPRTARASAHRKRLDRDRKTALQNLDIGDAGVGHVCMHRIRARRPGCRPRPAGQRFVVAEPFVAESHIVHAPLAGGCFTEESEHYIDNPLARRDIPADDRRGAGRIQKRTRRKHQFDRGDQPLVERQPLAQHRPYRVDDRRSHDSGRRILVAPHLETAPAEIEHRAALLIKRDRQRYLVPAVEPVGSPALLPGIPAEKLSYRRFADLPNIFHILQDLRSAALTHQGEHPRDPFPVGCRLGTKIAQVIRNAACPCPLQYPDDTHLIETPFFDQRKALEKRTLLVEARRKGRHRTGNPAADIGMMAAAGNPEKHPPIFYVWCSDRDVRQVRTPFKRRVRDVCGICFERIVFGDKRLDDTAHRAQMDRNMRCIGDKIAFGVENGTRKVQTLSDVGRNRTLLEHIPHPRCDEPETVR